jgi:hypothetical protein
VYDIEDITESMNEQGEEGTWYSVIGNMNLYRVDWRAHQGEFIFDENGKLSEDDELYKRVRKAINKYHEQQTK